MRLVSSLLVSVPFIVIPFPPFVLSFFLSFFPSFLVRVSFRSRSRFLSFPMYHVTVASNIHTSCSFDRFCNLRSFVLYHCTLSIVARLRPSPSVLPACPAHVKLSSLATTCHTSALHFISHVFQNSILSSLTPDVQ